MKPLAIVVPAFKAQYLSVTLRSIAAQTCHEFTVYVGDDASPEDLAGLCAPWQGAMDLRYTRFPSNLGATDLVAQWHRCVELTQEPWLWVFSDDDVMPPDSVERLLGAVEREGGKRDLFHFNVDRIDMSGRLICHEPDFPPLLSSREFALRRLRFELSSYAPDYIFSRAAFVRNGGFVSFPRAWCSDDATWIRLGARGGIRTLEGRRIGWRSSGHNISSSHASDGAQKVRAQVEFLRWLDRFLMDHEASGGEPDDDAILDQMAPWFHRQARLLNQRFVPNSASMVARQLSSVRKMSPWKVWGLMLRSDLRHLFHAARRSARGATRSI